MIFLLLQPTQLNESKPKPNPKLKSKSMSSKFTSGQYNVTFAFNGYEFDQSNTLQYHPHQYSEEGKVFTVTLSAPKLVQEYTFKRQPFTKIEYEYEIADVDCVNSPNIKCGKFVELVRHPELPYEIYFVSNQTSRVYHPVKME